MDAEEILTTKKTTASEIITFLMGASWF